MDFSKIETYLKAMTQEMKEDLKVYKKSKSLPAIEELEDLIRMHNFREIKPLKVEGLVINYKLLETFLKKVKHLPVDFEVGKSFLVKYPNGQLELFNIGDWYSKNAPIPETSLFELESLGL